MLDFLTAEACRVKLFAIDCIIAFLAHTLATVKHLKMLALEDG